MTQATLSLRELNRATLARQLLLERADTSALEVVHRFVGLQAQTPRDPYVGLWSRLDGFDVGELEQLLLDRVVVRLVVQRGTVHVVTADDCLVLRPLAQPILSQQLRTHRDHGPRLADVDLDELVAVANDVLAEPRTTAELRAALTERMPQHDPAALAFACRNLLAFIQVPPRGLWNASGEVVGTTARAWLGRDVERDPSVDAVILRYLAAFGPSTAQDAATWSRYTGLRDVFTRLRPQLVVDRGEDGREYFDVPDAPRPDPDVPAPVRLLPQFDNVLLSHKDRSRFVDHAGRAMATTWLDQVGFVGTILVDGMLAGRWRVDEPKPARRSTDARRVTLTVRADLPPNALDEIGAEAERFARFVDPSAELDVRLLVDPPP